MIANKVTKLVRRYKTTDPFELCDHLNIIVLYQDLGTINGFYRYRKRNKFITINNALKENEQRITCGHELGHAVLHTTVNSVFLTHNTFFSKNRFEIEANEFAAELLLFEFNLNQYEGLTLQQIATAENIPIELLKLKLDIA